MHHRLQKHPDKPFMILNHLLRNMNVWEAMESALEGPNLSLRSGLFHYPPPSKEHGLYFSCI